MERICSICKRELSYRETIKIFIGKTIYFCPECYLKTNNIMDEREYIKSAKRKKK